MTNLFEAIFDSFATFVALPLNVLFPIFNVFYTIFDALSVISNAARVVLGWIPGVGALFRGIDSIIQAFKALTQLLQNLVQSCLDNRDVLAYIVLLLVIAIFSITSGGAVLAASTPIPLIIAAIALCFAPLVIGMYNSFGLNMSFRESVNATKTLIFGLPSAIFSSASNISIFVYLVLVVGVFSAVSTPWVLSTLQEMFQGTAFVTAVILPCAILAIPLMVIIYNLTVTRLTVADAFESGGYIITNVVPLTIRNFDIVIYLFVLLLAFTAATYPGAMEILTETVPQPFTSLVIIIPALILAAPIFMILFNMFFASMTLFRAISTTRDGIYNNIDVFIYLCILCVTCILALRPGPLLVVRDLLPNFMFINLVVFVAALVLTPLLIFIYQMTISARDASGNNDIIGIIGISVGNTRDIIYIWNAKGQQVLQVAFNYNPAARVSLPNPTLTQQEKLFFAQLFGDNGVTDTSKLPGYFTNNIIPKSPLKTWYDGLPTSESVKSYGLFDKYPIEFLNQEFFSNPDYQKGIYQSYFYDYKAYGATQSQGVIGKQPLLTRIEYIALPFRELLGTSALLSKIEAVVKVLLNVDPKTRLPDIPDTVLQEYSSGISLFDSNNPNATRHLKRCSFGGVIAGQDSIVDLEHLPSDHNLVQAKFNSYVARGISGDGPYVRLVSAFSPTYEMLTIAVNSIIIDLLAFMRRNDSTNYNSTINPGGDIIKRTISTLVTNPDLREVMSEVIFGVLASSDLYMYTFDNTIKSLILDSTISRALVACRDKISELTALIRQTYTFDISQQLTMPSVANVQTKIMSISQELSGTATWYNLISGAAESKLDRIMSVFNGSSTNLMAFAGLNPPSSYIHNIIWESILRSFTDVNGTMLQSPNIDIGIYLGIEIQWLNLQISNPSAPWNGVISNLNLPTQSAVTTVINSLNSASLDTELLLLIPLSNLGAICPGGSVNAPNINFTVTSGAYYVNKDLLETARTAIINSIKSNQFIMSNITTVAQTITTSVLTTMQNRVATIQPSVVTAYGGNQTLAAATLSLPTSQALSNLISQVMNGLISRFANMFMNNTYDRDGLNYGSVELISNLKTATTMTPTLSTTFAKNFLATYANAVARKKILLGWSVYGQAQPIEVDPDSPTVIDIVVKLVQDKLNEWQSGQRLYNMYNRRFNIMLGTNYSAALTAAVNSLTTAGVTQPNASSYSTSILKPALDKAISTGNSYTSFISILREEVSRNSPSILGSVSLTSTIITSVQNAILGLYSSSNVNSFYEDSILINDLTAKIRSIVDVTTSSRGANNVYINTDLLNTAKNTIVNLLGEASFQLDNAGTLPDVITASVITSLQARYTTLQASFNTIYIRTLYESSYTTLLTLPSAQDLKSIVTEIINAIVPYTSTLLVDTFPNPHDSRIPDSASVELINNLRKLGISLVNNTNAETYAQSMITAAQKQAATMTNGLIEQAVSSQITLQGLVEPNSDELKIKIEAIIASIGNELYADANPNCIFNKVFLAKGTFQKITNSITYTSDLEISNAIKNKIKRLIFSDDLTKPIADLVATISRSAYSAGQAAVASIVKPKIQQAQAEAYADMVANFGIALPVPDAFINMVWDSIYFSWVNPDNTFSFSALGYSYPERQTSDLGQGTYIGIQKHWIGVPNTPRALLDFRSLNGWHTYVHHSSPVKIADYNPISSPAMNLYEVVAKLISTQCTVNWSASFYDMYKVFKLVFIEHYIDAVATISREYGFPINEILRSAILAGAASTTDAIGTFNNFLSNELLTVLSDERLTGRIISGINDIYGNDLARYYSYHAQIRAFSEATLGYLNTRSIEKERIAEVQNLITDSQAKKNRDLIYKVMSELKTSLMGVASGYDESMVRLNTYINAFGMGNSLNQDFLLKPNDAKAYKYTFTGVQTKRIMIMSDYDPDGVLPTSSGGALTAASLKVEDVYSGMLDILSSSNDPASSANIFAITDTIFELISNGLDITLIQNLYKSDRGSAVLALFNLDNNELNPLYALKRSKDPGLANIENQFAAVSQTNTAFQVIVKQITPEGLKRAIDAAPTRAGGTGSALAQFTEDIGGRYIRRVFYESAGLIADIYSQLNSIVTQCITIDNRRQYVHQPNNPIDLAWMRYDLQNWMNPLRGESGTQADNFINGGYNATVRATHVDGIKKVLEVLNKLVGIEDTTDNVQVNPGIKQKLISLLDYLISYNGIINHAFTNGVVGPIATGLRNSLQTRLSPRYFRLDENNRSMSLLGLVQVDYAHFHINVPLSIKKFNFADQNLANGIQSGLSRIGNIGDLSKFLNQFAVDSTYKQKRQEIAHAFISKCILDLIWWPYFCAFYMYPTDNKHRWMRDGTYGNPPLWTPAMGENGFHTTWKQLNQFLFFKTGATTYFQSPATCLAHGLVNVGMDMIYKELGSSICNDIGKVITADSSAPATLKLNDPNKSNNLAPSVQYVDPMNPSAPMWNSICMSYRHDALIPYCFFVGTQANHNSFEWLANNHMGYDAANTENNKQNHTDDMYLMNRYTMKDGDRAVNQLSWAGIAAQTDLIRGGFAPVPYYNMGMEMYLAFFDMYLSKNWTAYSFTEPASYNGTSPMGANSQLEKLAARNMRLLLHWNTLKSVDARNSDFSVTKVYNTMRTTNYDRYFGENALTTLIAAMKNASDIPASSFEWLNKYTSVGSGLSRMPNLPTDADFYGDSFWSKMAAIAVWLRTVSNGTDSGAYVFQAVGKHQLIECIGYHQEYDFTPIGTQYKWTSTPITNNKANTGWDGMLTVPPPPLPNAPFWKDDSARRTTAKFAALSGSVQQPDGLVMRSRIWCMLNFFQDPFAWFDRNRSYQIYPLNYTDGWLKYVTIGQYKSGVNSWINAYAIPMQTSWTTQSIGTNYSSESGGGNINPGEQSGGTTTTQINTTTTITSNNS